MLDLIPVELLLSIIIWIEADDYLALHVCSKTIHSRIHKILTSGTTFPIFSEVFLFYQFWYLLKLYENGKMTLKLDSETKIDRKYTYVYTTLTCDNIYYGQGSDSIGSYHQTNHKKELKPSELKKFTSFVYLSSGKMMFVDTKKCQHFNLLTKKELDKWNSSHNVKFKISWFDPFTTIQEYENNIPTFEYFIKERIDCDSMTTIKRFDSILCIKMNEFANNLYFQIDKQTGELTEFHCQTSENKYSAIKMSPNFEFPSFVYKTDNGALHIITSKTIFFALPSISNPNIYTIDHFRSTDPSINEIYSTKHPVNVKHDRLYYVQQKIKERHRYNRKGELVCKFPFLLETSILATDTLWDSKDVLTLPFNCYLFKNEIIRFGKTGSTKFTIDIGDKTPDYIVLPWKSGFVKFDSSTISVYKFSMK